MLMVMVMMMKMEASVIDMGEERMRSRGGGRRMRNRHGCRLKSFLTTTMINKDSHGTEPQQQHYWLLRMRKSSPLWLPSTAEKRGGGWWDPVVQLGRQMGPI